MNSNVSKLERPWFTRKSNVWISGIPRLSSPKLPSMYLNDIQSFQSLRMITTIAGTRNQLRMPIRWRYMQFWRYAFIAVIKMISHILCAAHRKLLNCSNWTFNLDWFRNDRSGSEPLTSTRPFSTHLYNFPYRLHSWVAPFCCNPPGKTWDWSLVLAPPAPVRPPYGPSCYKGR